MDDRIVRALSSAGGIRILACSSAILAREIADLQSASAGVSVALGRGLAGGALMGALLKRDQRIALKFEGNGPMRKLIIEADSDGAVRGSVANPSAEMEPIAGRWNVAGLLGRAGFLTVTKDLGLGREPYQGTVQLRSSEIGDDLAYYLTDSEQIPSAVGLTASLDHQGKIASCGGFLVQALPKAVNAEIDEIMTSIAALPPLSDILQEGGPELLLEKVMGGVAHAVLETREIFFRCGCVREKVERALLSLGRPELEAMIAEGGSEVTCEFCRRRYSFDAAELRRLLDGSA